MFRLTKLAQVKSVSDYSIDWWICSLVIIRGCISLESNKVYYYIYLPIDHDAGADGVSDGSEPWFFLSASLHVGHRAGEGEGQPVAHLARYRVRLHLA